MLAVINSLCRIHSCKYVTGTIHHCLCTLFRFNHNQQCIYPFIGVGETGQ
jgi:hypothetical protein